MVQKYQTNNFTYAESSLSKNLWIPLLEGIFKDAPEMDLIPEYAMSELEPTYPKLKVDFCIIRNHQTRLNFLSGVKNKIAKAHPRVALLFVEIAKTSLNSDLFSHKDQEKMAIGMAASLLKLFSLTWGRGKTCLTQLKIYGLLCGGTDFDVCRLYPVFPDDSSDEFFFVFESSKKALRFRILERNEEITSVYFAEVEERFIDKRVSCDKGVGESPLLLLVFHPIY